MIELKIDMTGKGYAKNSNWKRFAQEKYAFPDLAAAKEFLQERYGKCKRSPMYVDTKDGKTIKCGYVYGFRNSDVSHYPVDRWIQQDWVEFREVKSVEL